MLQQYHIDDSNPTPSSLTSHAPPVLTQSPAVVGVHEEIGEPSAATAAAAITQGMCLFPRN